MPKHLSTRPDGRGRTTTAPSPTGLAKAAGASLDRNYAHLSVEMNPLVTVPVAPVTGTAVAVCANAAPPGLEEVFADSALDSVDGKSAAALCPADTQVIGVGGALVESRGHTVIDDLRLVPSSHSVIVTGYEDQVRNPGSWQAQARALCAS